MIDRRLFPTLWLLIAAFVCGCGDGGASSATVSSGEGSVAKGLEAADKGDWAAAETELIAAIADGALQPDMSEKAILTLARARIELGKLDDAAKDIALIEQGAAEMDQVWLVKCALAIKKGDAAGAKAAFAEAKKFNPGVNAPPGL